MVEKLDPQPPHTNPSQNAARVALGLMLMTAGTSHLTFAREPFKAQVPPWVPLDPDTVVLQSGVVEIALGAALAFWPGKKALIGRIAGAFFTCIFPGNIAQWQHRRNAFGLDTDAKRFARLLFQPPLIAWALWSTGLFSCNCDEEIPCRDLPASSSSASAPASAHQPAAIGIQRNHADGSRLQPRKQLAQVRADRV